ncbi:hypothetical protein PPL_10537 [Heterostelium album PN500]|uniref:Uncharacterized protein n=1 Tax=Heterostelium pallidum (strain ATCC 26659 / Pp 5 / PN500) TaxID=670386 RepID=D3BRC9_HETP5|nr:hypothetical protein PPL_10537 [Heterostelium album PN500]EFA75961.1 hypothetical protein PPL_10537 [Heterostelium album PN500]|eukprot:XP_020428095.1 hypothetical protein PPL_10537 [Heterostelium album PN500]
MEPVTQILRKVKITLVGDNNVGRLSYLKTIVDGADDFKPSTENPSVFVRLPHILDSDFNQFYLELVKQESAVTMI